jgi:CHAT domain-containing protein/tetratricopeptide (TPR) repeat protein
MRRALAWLMVAVLCCATGARAGEEREEPRLEQAREAYDRALKFSESGRYAQALVQGEHALALMEAVRGRAHPETAPYVDLLGVLHQRQGDPARAEPLLRRGLELREAALGGNHPDVAVSLDHLASLYKAQGAYERAEPLYQRALAIQEAALGKDHPGMASLLNDLASLYMSRGWYERAAPLVERALAIQKGALAARHPAVAISLNNRALLFAGEGRYARAEPLYRRALAIIEATQGRNHPDVADLLNNLARLRLAQDGVDDALPLLRRAFAISEQHLRREALDLSESRLTRFMAHLRTQEELLYELARAEPENAEVRQLALTAALLRKGRSVEETAATSRTIYQRVSARDREAFERLRGLRSQLATLSLQGRGALTPAEYQQRIKELARQGDALEADLARRSAPLRALSTLPAPEDIVERVAAALPPDSALVEFIAYVDRALLPEPPPDPALSPPDELRYLALVLLPGGSIRALDLGAAGPIDSAAAELRGALANRDAGFQVPAEALYRRVFAPVRKALGGMQNVFLSPDGQLGLVPFAALHDGRAFLVDSYDFTYLTSGKDLLPSTALVAPSSSVVVLADPDFSAPVPPAEGKTPGSAERSFSVERFFSTPRGDMDERLWTPLPGTREEAEAIQRMIPGARLFLGAEATKERLLHLSAPGVLHLATHGFFLGDAAPREATRAVGHFGALGADALAARPTEPLLRSGLVLAGARAEAPDGSGAARPPPDGALVTALELASLNLWGTQLVVLSACDTGRGDVKPGQGVYGLRRAFVAAGAETVVMSLWKVNDATTRELMEGYYRKLLVGQGRSTALRQAMLALRRTLPHPHHWAPFIAAGQNAPLRALAPVPPGPPPNP